MPACQNGQIDSVGRLYLDLLKRSLTNTIFGVEPDPSDDTARYVLAAVEHYQQSAAVSMLPVTRLDNLERCIVDVIAHRVPGDLVETGVWRGGATIFMRAVLKVLGAVDRIVWAANSFEGLPEPDPEKYPLEAKAFKSDAMTKYYNHLAVGSTKLSATSRLTTCLTARCAFLKAGLKTPCRPHRSTKLQFCALMEIITN